LIDRSSEPGFLHRIGAEATVIAQNNGIPRINGERSADRAGFRAIAIYRLLDHSGIAKKSSK
jgi:hypothetical protein